MKDPFFLPPIPALSEAVRPWAERYGMDVLPLHIHELLGAALFYTFVHVVVSPVVSTWLFPAYYPRHSRSKKINWDSHVVSLVQSTLITVLALWVIFFDEERKGMDWEQRIWGYTGASAMIQSLAAGYFVWDFVVTVLNLDVFGLGLLAHASSALMVYSFGYRPFLNYYGTVFILYELSTPFLNVHWFCDKLNLTGSNLQFYNGLILLATFFGSRLVWGTAQSAWVWVDMYYAVLGAPDAGYLAAAHGNSTTFYDPDQNTMAFATNAEPIPLWLAGIYIGSNLVLNGLNWHWFFRMIAAVRKRFEPAKEKVPEKASAGKSTSTEEAQGPRKRGHSIKELVPDSEELRDGTIQ
ncbi:DUF887-domain-containing protein [Thozetella sp. PMI_491]|nr:DUF887-domain-containing protein [Thozetella sp. PMI_491]